MSDFLRLSFISSFSWQILGKTSQIQAPQSPCPTLLRMFLTQSSTSSAEPVFRQVFTASVTEESHKVVKVEICQRRKFKTHPGYLLNMREFLESRIRDEVEQVVRWETLAELSQDLPCWRGGGASNRWCSTWSLLAFSSSSSAFASTWACEWVRIQLAMRLYIGRAYLETFLWIAVINFLKTSCEHNSCVRQMP